MVDMVHYSWSTEKLPDESFYFFCSFWSKSFVSFSLKLLNMAISMSKFVSKICYYTESSNCDTQYPFGYGYIMQKDEMGNCVWVEGDFFRFTHLFILCCKFILRIFILEWRSPKLYIKTFSILSNYIEIYSVNTNHFHCGQLKVMQKNPVHSLLQIHKHFMLAITECNYCGRRKTFMYS